MAARPNYPGIFPTRIANLHTEPSQPIAGQPAVIKGYLQWWLVGLWLPLGGATVQIYVNGAYVGFAVTSGDGSFEFPYTFQLPGTYVVKAYYPGSSLYDPSSAVIDVTVLSPAQAAAQNIMLGLIIAAGVGLAAVLVVELVNLAKKQA